MAEADRSPFSGGKKTAMAALNLTAMVDMFTTLVIFLLASFQANGDILFIQKDLELPKAVAAKILSDRGPVITLFRNEVLMTVANRLDGLLTVIDRLR